jgi:hypothetical protein
MDGGLFRVVVDIVQWGLGCECDSECDEDGPESARDIVAKHVGQLGRLG